LWLSRFPSSRLGWFEQSNSLPEQAKDYSGTNADPWVQLGMNLYRITVRNQDGNISAYETDGESLELVLQGQDEQSDVVKVERIDRETKEVLGGFYIK
jgi:hypothetical protein